MSVSVTRLGRVRGRVDSGSDPLDGRAPGSPPRPVDSGLSSQGPSLSPALARSPTASSQSDRIGVRGGNKAPLAPQTAPSSSLSPPPPCASLPPTSQVPLPALRFPSPVGPASVGRRPIPGLRLSVSLHVCPPVPSTSGRGCRRVSGEGPGRFDPYREGGSPRGLTTLLRPLGSSHGPWVPPEVVTVTDTGVIVGTCRSWPARWGGSSLCQWGGGGGWTLGRGRGQESDLTGRTPFGFGRKSCSWDEMCGGGELGR